LDTVFNARNQGRIKIRMVRCKISNTLSYELVKKMRRRIKVEQ